MAAYVMTRLGRWELDWAMALMEQCDPDVDTSEDFLAALKWVFGWGSSQATATRQLLTIKQQACSVLDYSIEFCMLATQSQWTNLSLVPAFYHRLQDVIKDKLVHRTWDNNLEKLISLACDIEEQRRQRHQESRGCRRSPQLTLE